MVLNRPGPRRIIVWKRSYFAHEQEVRLLYISADRKREGEKLQSLPIEPNDLLTEVSFDPRLVSFERKEREAELRRLGYIGAITIDEAYQRTIWQLIVDRDWSPPAQA